MHGSVGRGWKASSPEQECYLYGRQALSLDLISESYLALLFLSEGATVRAALSLLRGGVVRTALPEVQQRGIERPVQPCLQNFTCTCCQNIPETLTPTGLNNKPSVDQVVS